MGKVVGFVNVLEKNKGFLGMMMVQLAYAGMAIFSKAAIEKGMSPYIFVVYRQAFATITLAPFAFFLDRFFITSLIHFHCTYIYENLKYI